MTSRRVREDVKSGPPVAAAGTRCVFGGARRIQRTRARTRIGGRMAPRPALSRRGFVGGVASALGAAGIAPTATLWARELTRAGGTPTPAFGPEEDYDGYAKLANNENPYGPPKSVLDAMTHAMKYSNRYGYPD